MKNYTNAVISALILTAFIMIAPSLVKAETTNGGDDVVTSQTTNGGDDVVASATTNGSDDVAASQTTNGSDDVVTSQTTNGSDDVGTIGTGGPAGGGPATNPPAAGGPSTSGSGTGSYSSGSGSNVASLYTAMNPATGDCSYISTYMKIGAQNNSAEVVKLQTFLKNNESFNVDINGIFDMKTSDAVKAFQVKYASDILAPWGLKNSTGNVFYTTQKKINELVCKKNLSLTASQNAQIAKYKNDGASDTVVKTDIKPVDSTTDQTAATANTSFFGKAWKFVKWLFGY